MTGTVSRRAFLASIAGLAGAAGLATAPSRASAATGSDGTTITAQEAMTFLRQGNERWASRDIERIDHTTKGRGPTRGQWPFAAVLSCADSRVNTENVFDVAAGNLFNVRNAGNVTGDISIGSLEYAVAVLAAPLLLVLGHSGCGAVKAAQTAVADGTMPGGDIDAVVNEIKPAIERLPAGHTLKQAIAANARHSTRQLLTQSSIIRKAVASKRLRIVEGVYDVGSREVEFLR